MSREFWNTGIDTWRLSNNKSGRTKEVYLAMKLKSAVIFEQACVIFKTKNKHAHNDHQFHHLPRLRYSRDLP